VPHDVQKTPERESAAEPGEAGWSATGARCAVAEGVASTWEPRERGTSDSGARMRQPQ